MSNSPQQKILKRRTIDARHIIWRRKNWSDYGLLAGSFLELKKANETGIYRSQGSIGSLRKHTVNADARLG
jgi:hypothetical protein